MFFFGAIGFLKYLLLKGLNSIIYAIKVICYVFKMLIRYYAVIATQ